MTIKKIAALAGVSRGTVDRVLNNRPYVKTKTREKVLKIIEKYNYKPNLAGKSLAFQKNPVKIGFILLYKNDPLFQEIQNGVKKIYHELKGFGLAIEYSVMNKRNASEQIKCIKELCTRNISALVLCPLDDEMIRQELLNISSNIKIVTYNTDISDIKKLCFVGTNYEKSGEIAGGLIGKLLYNSGNVLVISGPDSIKGLKERVAGFKKTIKQNYPQVKIVDVVSNVDDNETSYAKTVEYLKKETCIDAIFITARGIGGIGRALKEINSRKIWFVCFDKMPVTVQLIKEGIVDFSITQEPEMQGYLPIKILFEYFFHHKPPKIQEINTRIEIITKENCDL